MGVAMLSFPLSKTSATQFTGIRQWVSGPSTGIEVDVTTTDLGKIIQEYQPEFLVIDISMLAIAIQHPDQQWIIRLRTEEWPAHKDILSRSGIPYLDLLPGADMGAVAQVITEASPGFKLFIILSQPEKLDSWLNTPLYGITLEGTDEISPGLKDYEGLSEILERLETE